MVAVISDSVRIAESLAASSAVLVFLQALANDPVLDKVWSVLIAGVVGQLVVGCVFMIGFVTIVKRSIDKDIPAKLQSIDKHIEEIGRELIQMRRDVDRHSYKIESLEKWREDSLDDTRTGRRNPPGTRR